MAKPATKARLAAAAKGFTQVIGRGDASLITKDPSTGKCCFDAQVGGGWHYGAGLETDTAWVAGVAPWNYQMVKAGYNLFALSQFNQGQIIKWLDPGSGQSITFQPMALQWTNSLNQIQQISMPQSVAAQVSDDVLYWPAGYGSGRHFKYIASPSRLNKLLIIDSAASLPSTSYDTLELNFIISVSSGVNIMVNGQAWDKKTQTDTAQSIAFQLPVGAVLWSFAVPTAYDSSGLPERATAGSMRLKKSGSSLYVSVRFPKAWIDQAVFPIILDPTVDYSVGATGDDVIWIPPSGAFYTDTNLVFGKGGSYYSCAMRWTGVTIPAGATIDVAYITFVLTQVTGTPPACTLSFEDAANPAAPTTSSDANGRVSTTATVSITGSSGSAGTSWNSPSIKSIIEELAASNSYASGAAMICLVKCTSASNNNFSSQASWDHATYNPPALHIEYTEAAAGNPFYAYAQQQ